MIETFLTWGINQNKLFYSLLVQLSKGIIVGLLIALAMSFIPEVSHPEIIGLTFGALTTTAGCC